ATGPVAVGGLRLTAQVPVRDGVTTDLIRSLDQAGIRATSIAVRRPSLDDVFLTLTGHGTTGQRRAAASSDETGQQVAGWDGDEDAEDGRARVGVPQGGEAA